MWLFLYGFTKTGLGHVQIKQQTLRSPYPTQKVHQELPPVRGETCRNDCDPEAPLTRVNTTVDLSKIKQQRQL